MTLEPAARSNCRLIQSTPWADRVQKRGALFTLIERTAEWLSLSSSR